MKNALIERLITFKEAMVKGEFPVTDSDEIKEKNPCKYCKYGNICGKSSAESEV